MPRLSWSLLVVALAFGCSKSSPEEQIRASIDRTAKAAEAKDIGGVMELFSDDFGQKSGLTTSDVKRILFAQFHQSSWRRVFLLRTAVALDGDDRARAETTAVLASASTEKPEDAVGTNSGTYKFSLDFKKEGSDWKVVEARYERADLKQLLGVE